jgi:hypothetical protein
MAGPEIGNILYYNVLSYELAKLSSLANHNTLKNPMGEICIAPLQERFKTLLLEQINEVRFYLSAVRHYFKQINQKNNTIRV